MAGKASPSYWALTLFQEHPLEGEGRKESGRRGGEKGEREGEGETWGDR